MRPGRLPVDDPREQAAVARLAGREESPAPEPTVQVKARTQPKPEAKS